MTQASRGGEHPEDLPWNDAPADSDALPGSIEPDPAEVGGDEGEEVDAAALRIPDPYEKYRQETLDERLAEEEPDPALTREADPEAPDLFEAESDSDAELAEEDVTDPVEEEEPAAEEAAVHIRSDKRL